MQFVLLVYKNQERFALVPHPERIRVSAACDRWRDDLGARGHMRAMSRLREVETAATVQKSGTGYLVTDGPFAETKEVLAGFVVLECRDRAEAVELTKTFPGLEAGLRVEVRAELLGHEERSNWANCTSGAAPLLHRADG